MDQVRMGIVGFGTQGATYAAMIAEGRVPRMSVGAIADIDPDRLELASQRHPDVPRFKDHHELLASGTVDAVVTTVPHYLHPPIAIDAMTAGLHVLVEKPAGVYAKQVRHLNEFAASKPELTFAIMFNQRTNPLYIYVKELLDGGELGPIRHWNWTITTWWRPQGYYDQSDWRATWGGEGGGVLVNQAPHQLDLSQWLCGMPTRMLGKAAFGFRRNIVVEDEVVALYDYGDGVTGTFTTATHDLAGTDRLEILLDGGKIVVEDSAVVTVTRLSKSEQDISAELSMADVRRLFSGANVVEDYVSVDTTTFDSAWGSQHATVLTNFADHLIDQVPLIAPGADGIHGVQLANAILLSAWRDEQVAVPVDEDLYLAELNQHIVDEGRFTPQKF